MTLPYCCHIISQIEVEYNSSSDLPKWLVNSFKNPRNNNNFASFKDVFPLSTRNVDLNRLYSICDSYLQNFGVSMKHLYKFSSDGDEAVLPICDMKLENDTTHDENLMRSGYLSDSDTSMALKDENEQNPLDLNDILKFQLNNIISKSMVYYLSLYDEFSKNYELLNISKKMFSMSKNSTYEMMSGLRDCLSQLDESNDHEKEAIIITNDYSGIFSSNEILITRSSITFREELRRHGISYSTIYDEIQSYQTKAPKPKREHKHLSNLVNSYLTNEFKSATPNAKSQEYEADHDYRAMYKKNAKHYFLNSLRLPVSDDYDMNVIRVTGRTNCHKLIKHLDKSCMNILLSQNSDKSSFVRLVLANFPTLFSKVNQARFSCSNENGDAKMVIMGLIMPSVLMHVFNILKILESSGMANNTSIKVRYNLTFDDEMYEKTLRISENKIYDHFLKNFGPIRKKYTCTYKALKKLVPFSRFTLQNGNVSVSPKIINYYQPIRVEKTLSLDNKPAFSTGTELAIKQDLASADIVLVRDTLFFSLSMIRLYLSNIDGSSFTLNRSTMSFLDDAFTKVFFAHLRDLGYQDSSKCYIDLYPTTIDSRRVIADYKSDSTNDTEITDDRYDLEDHLTPILSRVSPQNFANVVWVLSYLLHCSGYSQLYDRKSLFNITNYDIFKINPNESALSSPMDTGRFNVLKSTNCPLSQQSYIVHIVNHINFNKQFTDIFNVKYTHYLKREVVKPVLTESQNIEVMESVLNLTIGWKSYFKHKSQEHKLNETEPVSNGNTDSIKTNLNNEDKMVYNNRPNSDNYSSHRNRNTQNGNNLATTSSFNNPSKEQFRNGNKHQMNGNVVVEPYVKGKLRNNDSIPVKSSFNVDFGTVYTSSRKHGRVQECVFDFDSQTTLDEMLKYGTNNILEEFNNIIKREAVVKSGDSTHYMMVFMFSNQPTIEECMNLKLLRNVLNSNLIKFNLKPLVYSTLDLNQLNHSNVSKFTKLFTANEFASGSKILEKNSVSYSLLSSDMGINEINSVLNQVDNRTRLKVIAFPLLEKSFESFDKSCLKLIKITNILRSDYSTNLEFVNITWIYDSYFQGIMSLSSIPDKYILHYVVDNSNQYSLKDFSIQHFKEESSSQYRLDIDELSEFNNTQFRNSSQESTAELFSQLTNYAVLSNITQSQTNVPFEDPTMGHDYPLRFKNSYVNIKQLWGWSVYLLNEQELTVSEEECTLYRNHCGIAMKRLDSLANIKLDIEKSLIDQLSTFNISEKDVEEFFTHDRILINSVVFSSTGSMPTDSASSMKIIEPKIGSKRICFGQYKGIPILNYKWLLQIFDYNIVKLNS